MKKDKKIHIRYFPFSPGIPWKVKGNRYIDPSLSEAAWDLSMKERDVVVTAYGGLIESFLSLSFIELVNHKLPGKKISWAGNPIFNPIVWMNGISRINQFTIPKEIFRRYPTPIFLDKNNLCYYNCLNNYLEVRPYCGGKGYQSKKAIIRQIVSNTTQEWDSHYLPQLRNLTCPPELTQWAKTVKFYMNQPYVCIFPDTKTKLSIHTFSTLRWSVTQIKAFASMLRSIGITLIIITNEPGKYYGCAAQTLPVNLDSAIYLLKSAKAVLSEEIDWLLVASLISEATLFGRKHPGALSLKKNNDFLCKENVIYMARELQPIDVLENLRESK